MTVFVVSLLIADTGGHQLIHTANPQPAQGALAEFNRLAGTSFTLEWFGQASTGGLLPFVYAAGPIKLLLVSAHQQ